MDVLNKIGVGIAGLAVTAISLFGVFLHVWTIVVAYIQSGLIGATVTFIFPVLAQIYWFFRMGISYGFGCVYCVSVLAYLASCIVLLLCVVLMGRD